MEGGGNGEVRGRQEGGGGKGRAESPLRKNLATGLESGIYSTSVEWTKV